ncbi:hypothetical protein YC2023_011145 [Brassica napus]
MNVADVAMVRMQADGRLPVVDRRNYKSVLDAIAQMVRGEGVTLLWRGSSMTINRAMLVTASQLATFAAGFVASVASNPVDVIKTRVMNMKVEAGKTVPYKGAVDCALKTVRAVGIIALYKGFLPTVSRQAPFTMIMPTRAVHLLSSQGFIELSQISTNHRQCLPLLLPLLKNLFPPQPLTISALV